MSDVKQVKVANWGIYFLQRLKHFFNRTDYCDLTLQFQDNAQLKVHRLVLSACTEYFELLERTCEMYEDCLVMPDDLQADVVVPIVNFMYTGQLEFKMELLERLYQTSQVLNLPVLTKLLESHRIEVPKATPTHSYSKKAKASESSKAQKSAQPSTMQQHKRSYSKAFDKTSVSKEKKVYHPVNKSDSLTGLNNSSTYRSLSPISNSSTPFKKAAASDPRPSRYELPEELDQDNIFDSSFSNISYTSKPLMVHPEAVKHFSLRNNRSYGEASGSRKLSSGISTLDIVECKRVPKEEDSIFGDNLLDNSLNDDMFPAPYMNIKDDIPKDSSQLFDQILDQGEGPKVTIETKDSKLATNIDHAKIISEVLKKYPHLVKSNKNIKLKILNTQTNTKSKKQPKATYVENKPVKLKPENEPDFTYETDVLDSKEAAKLIALGAENIKGPWICLICGTPGKALHFTSYYNFRRHLVDVHNEKPVSNICEYCGLKALKRNYFLYHLYSQHGIEPPPHYHFPKCKKCNYIALTEGFLVKHELSHEARNFRCNVCAMSFNSSNQLLTHIQITGHKYSGERKTNLQCIYCLKVFLRETNLYTHLKTHHKKEAKNDGIIDDSDEEKMPEVVKSERYHNIKIEPSRNYSNDSYEVDVQFQIQRKPDGDIQVIPRKQQHVNPKQKILNSGFGISKPAPKPNAVKNQLERSEFLADVATPTDYEDIVMIDNNEYVVRDHQLIPRKEKINDEFILSDLINTNSLETMQPSTSMEFTNQTNNFEDNVTQPNMIIKNSSNLGQPIQIVVSNEEEYKALMSSNHPIIFDNSDSNKTLTMLTAPHESTLGSTTIDLDKTQSNNMMIIPEDYPLSVTETVTTDNPNIVVVYSHPIHDQNKQYQIITTQAIDSQFVQSSTMITQNYETVTTSTPVMSAHVLDTQVEETWPNNVQTMEPQHEQVAPEAELHTIIQSDHVEMTPVSNQVNENLHEENIMTPEPSKEISTQTVQVDETEHMPPIEVEQQTLEQDMTTDDHTLTDQSDAIISESQDQLQTYEPSQVYDTVDLQESSTTMETEVLCENEIDKENNEFVSTESSSVSEVVPQVETNPENTDIHEPMEIENEVIENVTEETPQHEDIVETALNTSSADVTEDNTLQTEIVSDAVILEAQEVTAAEPQEYTEMAEITPAPAVEEITCNKKPDQKIQNLTSEWSEDEYDTVPEDTDQPAEVVTKQVEEPECLEETSETEETIENIRHEVEKQMNTVPVVISKKTDENDVPQEENIPMSQPQQVDGIEATDMIQVDTKEKISTLLTDWEDNESQEENDTSLNTDSQEENVSVNENEHVGNVVEDSPQQPEQETMTETQDPKVDSIKKLVSDWDEDEDEEIKE